MMNRMLEYMIRSKEEEQGREDHLRNLLDIWRESAANLDYKTLGLPTTWRESAQKYAKERKDAS